eukprot:12205533-Ditylum_brightwellii.AAC.1
MNYLDQAGIGSDSWRKLFTMEGKSDVTIGIRIRIAYMRNYASVVRLTFQRVLGCHCLFGEPAASRVVHVQSQSYPVPQDMICGFACAVPNRILFCRI